MTIASSVLPEHSYVGNGVLDTFPYAFRIFTISDLKVAVNGVLQAYNTNYTITNINNPNGGNVIFSAGSIPANGAIVYIVCNMPMTQLVDYNEYDAFPAETHEKALDKLTRLVQQQGVSALKSLRLPFSSTASTELPNIVPSMFVKANAAGTGFEFTSAVPPGVNLFPNVDSVEVDIASAATTDIWSVNSYNIRITGTTTITSFGIAEAGVVRMVRVAGALILTHHSTSLILPGGKNITTAAGDTFEALSLGSGNWVVRDYMRADGRAVTTSVGGESFKVAIIGDSLSQEGAFLGSWPNVFADFCRQSGFEVEIKCFAVGGHTFHKAMNELSHAGGTKTQVQMAITYGANLVIVALGINDCVYAPVRSQAQIIQDGQDVFNLLRAGLPLAKIVLMKEAPHNYETLGLTPGAITNADAVPASHQTITYRGQIGCRVNNSTWTGTSIGATNIAKHGVWGNVMTSLASFYDDSFYCNMWKIARMGCNVDLLHVDYEGHYWMALYVINWFDTNNGFDNNILNLTSGWWSLDLFYPIAAGSTREAYVYGNYRGINVKTKMVHWMYAERGLEVSLGPSENISGYTTQLIKVTGADPGAQVWYGWDTGNIVNTSRFINSEGIHQAVYTPYEIGSDITPGVHTAVTAIRLSDGTFDCFQKTITLITGSPANPFNQNLNTTNSPTFNALTTTGLINGVDVLALAQNYGNTVNQDLRTTASPTFNALTTNGLITTIGGLKGGATGDTSLGAGLATRGNTHNLSFKRGSNTTEFWINGVKVYSVPDNA